MSAEKKEPLSILTGGEHYYQILQESNPAALSFAVADLMLAGWKPQGGVSVTACPQLLDGIVYAQAMVRDQPTPK